jgi:uncharacterized protein YkwD
MPAQPTDSELYLLNLVNATRANEGASALISDGELNVAADNHGEWLDANEPAGLEDKTKGDPHVGENGSHPADRIGAAGYEATATGENIYFYYGTDETGATAAATPHFMDKAHEWFLNSPGHHATMVNPGYGEVGISAVEGNYHGFPAVYVTEDFGTPTAAEAAETDKYTGTGAPPPVDDGKPATATPSELETYFLSLVNDARQEAGAPALHANGQLQAAADGNSAWMDEHDSVSSTGTGENGSNGGDRIAGAGYHAAYWAENVWFFYGDGIELNEATVDKLHQQLMDVPETKARLLDPKLEDAGIGLEGGDYQGHPAVYVTQDFAQPMMIA